MGLEAQENDLTKLKERWESKPIEELKVITFKDVEEEFYGIERLFNKFKEQLWQSFLYF